MKLFLALRTENEKKYPQIWNEDYWCIFQIGKSSPIRFALRKVKVFLALFAAVLFLYPVFLRVFAWFLLRVLYLAVEFVLSRFSLLLLRVT